MNAARSRFHYHGTVLVAAALALPMSGAHAYSAGKWQSATQIYDKVCAYCHDISIAPPLFGRDLPISYIRNVVLQGRGPMPAFRPTDFSEEELAALGKLLQQARAPRATALGHASDGDKQRSGEQR